MKSFARLLRATLAMMASLVTSVVPILLATGLVLKYFGLVQALAAMLLTVSLVIATLIHWSEQDNFPFR